MRKLSLVTLAVAIAFTGAACDPNAVSDERPSAPKKVAKKRIDPAHYKTERKCSKKNSSGNCVSYTTKTKITDDKDWILVTSDGIAYDVDEGEYNSVNVGDYWPR